MAQDPSTDPLSKPEQAEMEGVEMSFDEESGRTSVVKSDISLGGIVDDEKGDDGCNITSCETQSHEDEDLEAAFPTDNDSEEHAMQPTSQRDVHIQPAHYPGDGEQHRLKVAAGEADQETSKEDTPSCCHIAVEWIKYLYSATLLGFSILMVMAAIFSEETTATQEHGIPSIVEFLVFWFLILWLAMIEGGQGCIVGLQPIDKALYAQTHPRTHKITSLAHKGDNMERFIVGRQFLAVLVIFVTNFMGAVVEDANVLNMNDLVMEIFLNSGVAVILITVMLGQLTAQVNAANCMLDFINNYFMLFTTYMSLGIEMSGLLHSVYLVQMFFAKVTGTPIDSNEPPQSVIQQVFFWGRVLLSTAILGFAFAVTLTALFDGKTTMWDGAPEAVSVIVFFLLMCFVGMLEGMQIALFAIVNLPEEELQHHTIALRNCQLTFAGQNLQAFLIGRQICVTICVFVIARITTIDVDTDAGDETIFGVSKGLQGFFNTGLLGAVITTIVGSLAWRVVAASFPFTFMSNPLIYVIIRLCLLLESSGLCSAAWLLARIHKHIVGYQLDEVYIGTREARLAPTHQESGDLEPQEEEE